MLLKLHQTLLFIQQGGGTYFFVLISSTLKLFCHK